MGGACGKSSRSAQAVAPEANKTVEAQPAAKTRLPPAVDVSQNDSSTSPVGPSSPGSGSGIWGFPVPTIVVTPAQNQMGAPPVALSHPRAICRDYRVEPPSDYATEEGIAFQGIEAAAADAPRDINDTLLKKFHSAIRWGKPLSDIAELLDATPALLEARDPGNGNRAIHIAAQNGLSEHTKFFLQRGCKVNAQNNKGNTALHMSIEYEFFGESEALLRHGASGTLENASGHRAITGLDGTKIKSDGWDSPLRLLKAAETKEAMEEALNALETVGDGYVEKVALVQTGLKKKREFPDIWDNDRFTKILKKPDSWFLKKDTKADEGEEKAAVRMLMEDGDGEQPAAKEE